MRPFEWPGEDGWPYPDSEKELADPDAWFDDDAVDLRASPPRLDALDPLERQVIVAHYGMDGTPPRSMKQLHQELDLPRADIRSALAAGLAKLRTEFRD
jgi:DNA-directed RNA polymerase sigma subunit (sigma70/sigma32)